MEVRLDFISNRDAVAALSSALTHADEGDRSLLLEVDAVETEKGVAQVPAADLWSLLNLADLALQLQELLELYDARYLVKKLGPALRRLKKVAPKGRATT